jgi:multidrug efflux pump subunit AcrA (membrane-fusion protein)
MKLQKLCTFLLYITIVLSVGCSGLTAEPDLGGISVQLDDYWEYNPEIVVVGRVVLNDVINLSFPLAGHVSELHIEEGDFVSEGDLLAELNRTTLESELYEAEAALSIAQANLARILAGSHPSQIDEAESIIESIRARVLTDSYSVNEQEADLAAAEARLAYLKALPLPEVVAIAQAEVGQVQATVDAIEANLMLTDLIAPRDGTITSVEINAYEYARVGATVLTIGDINNLSVEGEVDDLDIQEIVLGGKALIWFYGISDYPINGTVTQILPKELLAGNDFIVRINFDEIPEGIRWGMSAEIRFPAN